MWTCPKKGECPKMASLMSRDWGLDELLVEAEEKMCSSCLDGFTMRLEDIGRNPANDHGDCERLVQEEVKRFAGAR